MIFIFSPFERWVSGAFLWLSNAGGGYRHTPQRPMIWRGHGQKTRFWISRVLLGWLSGTGVDFPTSDDFYFLTIWKISVRRVFIATKLRWGVPGSLSTNHELKRSWCGQNSFKMTSHLKAVLPHHDLFSSWFVERDPGTPHRSLVAIKTRLTLIFQMVKK